MNLFYICLGHKIAHSDRRFKLNTLARIIHEGNEDQGKYGKQGWLITWKSIAVAMVWKGSAKIGSQIFPEFVQVQTVIVETSSKFHLTFWYDDTICHL